MSIYISRFAEQARVLAEALSRFGRTLIAIPSFEILPRLDDSRIKARVETLYPYDYIVFTSVNAVTSFDAYRQRWLPHFNYPENGVIAIGAKTADHLTAIGLPPVLVPENYNAVSLRDSLGKIDLAGKKFLLPLSELASDETAGFLRKSGAQTVRVDIYGNALPPVEVCENLRQTLGNDHPESFIFTSPSAFNNFKRIMDFSDPEAYFSGSLVIAIGPATAAAIKAEGIDRVYQPEESTLEGLTGLMIRILEEKASDDL